MPRCDVTSAADVSSKPEWRSSLERWGRSKRSCRRKTWRKSCWLWRRLCLNVVRSWGKPSDSCISPGRKWMKPRKKWGEIMMVLLCYVYLISFPVVWSQTTALQKRYDTTRSELTDAEQDAEELERQASETGGKLVRARGELRQLQEQVKDVEGRRIQLDDQCRQLSRVGWNFLFRLWSKQIW